MSDITYLRNPSLLPALDADLFDTPTSGRLTVREPALHKPRFLMLYGSVRERSYSRLLTFEAARLLEAMGGEVKIFARPVCRYRTASQRPTPRCRNCANSPNGPKEWSGLRRSGMAP